MSAGAVQAETGPSGGNPIEVGQAAEGVAAHSTPPPTVAGRRNLRYFESRPPPTDFETWEQAETALQAGVSMPELVKREFVRDFGPDVITCAPPCPCCVLFGGFCMCGALGASVTALTVRTRRDF